jgi:carbon monoxide dehydrogenase subunit G
MFSAPREVVWRVLNDPHAMAKTMPGVESINVHDDRRWTAKVKVPLGLGGLRLTVDMETVEERAPEFARMAIKGSGVGATMTMETSFTLGEAAGGATAMAWTADVAIAGPVGSMGQPVLGPIVGRQVEHVLEALDREVQEAMRGSAA